MVRPVGETNVTDGRLVRANRTRDGVVDALLALIDEGNLRPTAREIAARANVSLRSLYVHFDDVEALFYAASLRHAERLEAHRTQRVLDGPFEDRLTSFLDSRARYYEVGWNVRQAAVLQEPFSPALRAVLEKGRKASRADLQCAFGPEIDGDDERLAALDVITNPVAWHVLCAQHGMALDQAKQVIGDLVRSLFGFEAGDVGTTGPGGAGDGEETRGVP
jgi:TetR/AcrR family transcriptional regulator, regulator of autoinduction and epiphytic fitness